MKRWILLVTGERFTPIPSQPICACDGRFRLNSVQRTRHWRDSPATLISKRHDPMVQVVASDCGVLRYYSRLRVIDFFGPNNRHIALHGTDVDYVFNRRPELIIVSPHPRDKPIREDVRLGREYTLIGQWPGFYTLGLYCRKDFQLPKDGDDKGS